ncbi:hypothetical protein GMLC_02040 [Geomonas limicola]|uniref:DUF1456 domain-containing protein n=1 Tax=Geomonas limicola TaxID=2740186 RepID=A0A6V8N280_9BACT|nr:DUF1456 family protein [Geomonas limicola]GFO66625.1 hypothetical protein GMLC_02040 [Geomonas limicola]
MTNNDVLRRVRYALDLSNPTTLQIFRLADQDVSQTELLAFLKKEEDEGYLPLGDALLEAFLDGLIALRRGKREDAAPVPRTGKIGNNDVLKKLRVALELKEGDLLEICKLAGFPTSKSELGALFRTKGHANYKECGDQLLRNFLKGLTLKYRDNAAQN